MEKLPTESLDVICPYKAVAGFYCYHRNNSRWKKKKVSCNYKNNPHRCPFFQNWRLALRGDGKA